MFDDHTAGSFVGTLELFSEVPLLHQHALPRGKLICFEVLSFFFFFFLLDQMEN